MTSSTKARLEAAWNIIEECFTEKDTSYNAVKYRDLLDEYCGGITNMNSGELRTKYWKLIQEDNLRT